MVKRREPTTRHKSDEEFNSFIEGADTSVQEDETPSLDPSAKRKIRLTVTVNEYEHDLLIRAANARAVLKTSFLRSSAVTEAQEILEKE
jgi:hypothetical protein